MGWGERERGEVHSEIDSVKPMTGSSRTRGQALASCVDAAGRLSARGAHGSWAGQQSAGLVVLYAALWGEGLGTRSAGEHLQQFVLGRAQVLGRIRHVLLLGPLEAIPR